MSLDCEKIILLGDIMDRGGIRENIANLELIANNLDSRVTLLIGNHDIVYLNDNRLRVSPTHYKIIAEDAPDIIVKIKNLFRTIYEKKFGSICNFWQIYF
jgi:calcineurin-like phosphoesterase family protein